MSKFDTEQAIPDRNHIVNEAKLNSVGFNGDFAINRAALTEFTDLVESSKRGDIPVNLVIAFIDPDDRYCPRYSVTAFGIGWNISQGTTYLDLLEGYTAAEAQPLKHKVYESFDNIWKALGLPDRSIMKKNEYGELEYLPNQPVLGSDTDPIVDYVASVNKLFDYYESLFSPADVIAYCERNKLDLEKYLANGINTRFNKPLKPEEISQWKRKIKGYEEAIARNKSR